MVAAPVNVLILLAFPEAIGNQYLERLRAEFPQLTIDLVDHHSKVGAHIADAEILVTFGAHMADHVLEQGVRLRWIQALGTGVDGIADRPALREGVIVTNLRGLHGPAVSESVLASMLALARDLRRSLANQAQARWARFPVSLLKGRTVGILGIGVIAEELAPKCRALGMRVVGISSANRPVDGFDRIWSRDRLEDAVRELDHLVLLTPYSEATRGIVNERVLAAMKPTCFLINVARGGIVDEPALITALTERRIAGAALDVFSEEPLRADHPFWALDNVLLTPHIAGFHTGYADDAIPLVVENMRRFLAGDVASMVNVVPR